MTDNNRGAYTPQSDAPLAFDARRSGGSGQRPLPLTLIISGVILVVLVLGALVLYKNGPRNTDAGPQAVGETLGTVKAPAEAKPVEASPGLQVYADGEPIPPATKLAPAPEQPLARPTTPQIVGPSTPAIAPAAPAPVTKTASTPPAAPVTAVPTPKAPVQVAVAAPKAPAPVAKTPAATPVPAPSSTAMAQIGAFSSNELANAGWNKVARMMPGDMVGKTKTVEPVERDGKTLYRTIVGGFASRADAEAFCKGLQGRGEVCQVKN
ncbi:cell division protein FtsN [soil metagenome]